MSLLDKIFGGQKQPTYLDGFKLLTGYSPAFTSWNGQIYESELVRAAIDARARHVSKLKVEILGSARPKLQTKLKQRPNEWQTWSQFLYRTSTILDVCNTVFIVPVQEKLGDISGYFPVLPYKCEIKEYHGKEWLRYEFARGQMAAVELASCIIMTKFQCEHDVFGSNNGALNDTMKLINIQNQGIEEAVKTSASYRFMAQMSNFLKPGDLKAERKNFTRENLSADSGGGMLLFPNTYTNIKQITTTPFTVDEKQMQLIRTNVYNYFGVNEEILQNKAFGDAWSAFYEGCVEVFAVQFGEAATKCLFTERERSAGAEIMLSANRLQYMSNADKLAISTDFADRGIMSINEIRDIWNLPHVEGGDVRTIRGEYYDANDKTGDSNDEPEDEPQDSGVLLDEE